MNHLHLAVNKRTIWEGLYVIGLSQTLDFKILQKIKADADAVTF